MVGNDSAYLLCGTLTPSQQHSPGISSKSAVRRFLLELGRKEEIRCAHEENAAERLIGFAGIDAAARAGCLRVLTVFQAVPREIRVKSGCFPLMNSANAARFRQRVSLDGGCAATI
jgi:hypothetical protein